MAVPASFVRELPEGKRDCTEHVQKGQLHRQQQNGDILWTHEKRNVLWKEIRYKKVFDGISKTKDTMLTT